MFSKQSGDALLVFSHATTGTGSRLTNLPIPVRIGYNFSGGSGSGSGTPQPQQPAVNTPPAAELTPAQPEILRQLQNNERQLNTGNALDILRVIAGVDNNLCPDLKIVLFGDRDVTTADALKILRIVAGLDCIFDLIPRLESEPEPETEPVPLTQTFPPVDIPNGVLNIIQDGNDIHIQANFSFDNFTREAAFEDGMCYREAFLQGIIEHWGGSIDEYNVTVELGIVESGAIPVTLNRTLGLSFMRPIERGWWRNNPGRVVMQIGYSSIYSLERYMWVSAHEFGHILGIGDMYGDYSILNLDSIMSDNFSISVQPRDIKMALIAWERNDWQPWDRHALQPWNQ
jgi:hypothetical protein